MRQPIGLQSQPALETQARSRDLPAALPCTAAKNRRSIAFAVLAAMVWFVPFLLDVPTAAAQTTTTPPAPAHKPAQHHAKPSAAAAAPAPLEIPVPVQAPAPVAEVPHWPANDHPVDAAVTWDSQGLSIQAANSSLQQILDDFSAATGAKVEGLGTDQRVFGAYGPGLARDVLSQLLQGSGYNVLMIGDQGQGAPREIVLTPRQPGDAQAAKGNQPTANDEDSDADDAAPQPSPVPNRPGFNPGAPINPRERMQEIQQRRQQLEQNQQNGQPGQTLPPPPSPSNPQN